MPFSDLASDRKLPECEKGSQNMECSFLAIACRDIKLENVLLVPAGDDPTKPPDVKLSDFG